ncbi:hypothetical protein DPMN_026439 [Dreissena polymorpha]|uniref:Uncharacterized protein n=1 Tax=Dreissena polymorpha TaxID=45954 RepID=A0A9D4LR47_DREPO|nr:hypothetical protein DPMN_026439 [Dreissena polymorpha]
MFVCFRATSELVNKDAPFAALKDLQQKHDMLRLLTKGRTDGGALVGTSVSHDHSATVNWL